MTRVLLPNVLRSKADGNSVVEVSATTVGQALVELTKAFPVLQSDLLDDNGDLRNYVNVFVGDENIRDRDGVETEISANDEILIVPALAGG